MLDDALRPVGWTWLLNAPDQQVAPGGLRLSRKNRRRPGGATAGSVAGPGNATDLVSGWFVPPSSSGAFAPPWSAHAIDARLLAFRGGRKLLVTFVRSCHARQPCEFGVWQVHVTGKPAPSGGVDELRAWANPSVHSSRSWAQGRNQALFEAALAPPASPTASPHASSGVGGAEGADTHLLVAPWPGLVASFGTPAFHRTVVSCAPWAAAGAKPRKVLPWTRRQNRALCGTTPAGSTLEIELMGAATPPRLLQNHTARLARAFDRHLLPLAAPQRAPERARRSLTTHMLRVDFGEVAQAGGAMGGARGRGSCVALLGVGHIHHTDGHLNQKRQAREGSSSVGRSSVGSSSVGSSSAAAAAAAAPFLFGADYDHYFFTMEPTAPFAPLAVSEDFCLGGSASAAGDCERVQFVSGLALEDGRPEAAHAAWLNATREAGGTWAEEDGGATALLLSYGVNDCEARVARISLAHVRRLLRPLPDATSTAVCVPDTTQTHQR